MIITGVGGQGNVLASQVVGEIAVKNGYQVTIGETFGPLIPPNQADMILGLEPLETLRIVTQYGNSDTVFIVNTRPIHPLNVIAGDVAYPKPDDIKNILKQTGKKLYWIDATDEALALGNPILMNMIMIGAACALPEFPFDTKHFKAHLTSFFHESKLSVNNTALEKGKMMVLENEK